ncbi:MAG: hypothetical protein GEU74_05740 [Nitriliruptorales bacterium]|nr:hypothetical protein [Nitriliruptorales bacterium]
MDPTWRSRLLVAAIAVVALAAVVLAVRLSGDRDQPAAAPIPAPTASPTTASTPQPTPQPGPFKVTLRGVKEQPLDRSNMYGRKPGTRRKLARQSAGKAVNLLERYLNTVFARPTTRSKPQVLKTVLTRRARRELRPRDRAALGVRGPAIAGGRKPRAVARVTVLHDGRRVSAMTLRFRAAMKVVTATGKRTALRQRGVFVLMRPDKQWRIDMIDVELVPPERGPPKEAQPADPPPTSTEAAQS